jgi:hypothetical protein
VLARIERERRLSCRAGKLPAVERDDEIGGRVRELERDPKETWLELCSALARGLFELPSRLVRSRLRQPCRIQELCPRGRDAPLELMTSGKVEERSHAPIEAIARVELLASGSSLARFEERPTFSEHCFGECVAGAFIGARARRDGHQGEAKRAS